MGSAGAIAAVVHSVEEVGILIGVVVMLNKLRDEIHRMPSSMVGGMKNDIW